MGRSCWCTRARWVTEGPTVGSGSTETVTWGHGAGQSGEHSLEGRECWWPKRAGFGVSGRAVGSQPGAQGLPEGEGGKGKRPWGFSRVAGRGMVTNGCGQQLAGTARALGQCWR